MPLSPEDAGPWATLHALGLKPDEVPTVLEAGGPRALLHGPPEEVAARLNALKARRPRRGGRPRRRATGAGVRRAASQVPRAVDAFLRLGGAVFGGDRRGDVARLDRPTGRALCYFGRGDAGALSARPAAAVIGTREADKVPRLAERAHRVGRRLVEAGGALVSGGARGVDRSAHQGAMAAGGGAVIIVGEPVQPSGKLRLSGGFADERTLILSPFAPCQGFSRRMLVSRNGLIAAQADLVVVVAGSTDSGTRHAVRAALALGIPVAAFPGDVEDPLSGLGNALIASRRAHLLRSEEDVVRLLGLEPNVNLELPFEPGEREPASDALAASSPLLEALIEPRTIGELADALGWTAERVLVEATELELTGQLKRVGAHLARR